MRLSHCRSEGEDGALLGRGDAPLYPPLESWLGQDFVGEKLRAGGGRPARGCGEAGWGSGGDAGYHWARGTAGQGLPCGPVPQVSGA